MIIFFIAIIALTIGSFASLASYRLAKNQPIVYTRSRCVNCGFKLGIKNLIPLFSWLLQRGKCSNCLQRISLRYPLIELSFAISFISLYLIEKKIDANFMLFCLVFTTLITMAIIDIEEYFIANSLQYCLIFLALLLIFFNPQNNLLKTFIDHSLGCLLYGGFGVVLLLIFRYTAKIEALGIDDIKLLFVIGFLLGTSKFLAFILMTGIFGLLFGSIWVKIKNEETFPFAPALCMAAFLSLILSQKFSLVDALAPILFLQNF